MSWQDILKNMPERWDEMGNLFRAYIFDGGRDARTAESTLLQLYEIYSGGKTFNDALMGEDTQMFPTYRSINDESRSPEVMRDD